MSTTAVKPLLQVRYEQDFHAWTQRQAQLLLERRWSEVDAANIIDELETLGRREKSQIKNRLQMLVAHLLKWQYQPSSRSPSWVRTIKEQRRKLLDRLSENPSLKHLPAQSLNKDYLGATLIAEKETGIPLEAFPGTNPFSIDDVLDPEFSNGLRLT